MSRKMWVGGNWKMNGSLQHSEEFISDLDDKIPDACEAVIFPTALHLLTCQQMIDHSISRLQAGSQNMSTHDDGAYTGEISVEMLQDASVQWVLVGHSERRQYHGETNDDVQKKLEKALQTGLNPVLCVGENLTERQANQTMQVINDQLAVLTEAMLAQANSPIVIAYEPVWAIGTGEAATPEQAQEVHAKIRQYLSEKSPNFAKNVRIVYGGSVKPANAKQIFSMADVDGGLVGGASLQSHSFLALCEIAADV